MSTIFNYDVPGVARSYDRLRQPFGVDVVAGLLQVHCGKSLKDIHLLDAGCGTGQYAKALIGHGLGRITLLDASSEMLSVARDKLKDAIQDYVVDAVVQAKLPDIPFKDEIFDAVMFAQVLNHLELEWNGVDFPILEKTLVQAKRVLRPNGLLVLITASPSIMSEAQWCSQIHPEISEILYRIFPSLNQHMALFTKHSYNCVAALNMLLPRTPGCDHAYFNPEGPLDEDWRIATSMFQIAGPEKEKEMIKMVLDMKVKGTLKQFVADHDRTSEMGVMTLLVCISV